RRIAHPGVAVVPVALAADVLRQARGRRGDDRAGGPVGEQLERERRAVHHLPPAALVDRVREPAPPEPHGALERLGRGALADRLQLLPARVRLQEEGGAGPVGQVELGGDVVAVALERHVRRQSQRERGGVEDGPALVELHLVRLAGGVEARPALEPEAHLAAHRHHLAHQPAGVARVAVDRHEVVHLADAVGGHEAGDEDVRVGEVELAHGVAAVHRRDPPEAALVGVEDRREHAGRIEPRAAEPVDGAVSADERDAVQVADHAVLGDGQVGAHRAGGVLQDGPDAHKPGLYSAGRRAALLCPCDERGGVVQLVRTPACHAAGRQSRTPRGWWLVTEVVFIGLSIIVLVSASRSRQYFYSFGVLAVNFGVLKVLGAPRPLEPWRRPISGREHTFNKCVLPAATGLSALGWIATGSFGWVPLGFSLGALLTVGHRWIRNSGTTGL